MTAFWTDADAAELDVLVHTLVVDFWAHREWCAACRPEPCPIYEAWLAHKADCRVCERLAPLTFGWSCPVRQRFLDEHRDCARCNPCPHLQTAVAAVVEWWDMRALLSRAEALRAQASSA